MPQDLLRELLELAAVNRFYAALLEDATGQTVPMPRQAVAGGPAEVAAASASVLRAWLNILDLAINPVLVRNALRDLERAEIAEALLRYYFQKLSKTDNDRDKTDFVISYLYRNPPEWRKRPRPETPEPGASDLGALNQRSALEFEGELHTVLGGLPAPELPQEHQQLLREFEFIEQEVDDFRHFDQLMDSGVVQRVRGIKQAMGGSFYHPRVMARVAVYNTFFGARFDQLFAAAASEIKGFAAKVQQEGASILSRVEGDVTVQNLAEVEEQHILTQDYAGAQESFRKVSRFKKAVSKRAGRAAAAAPPPPPPAAAAPTLPEPAAPSAAASSHARKFEEGKTRGVLETIRAFVRAADPSAAGIVPLRGGNAVLTPAEVDAFRVDYGAEKSFRVDLANCLTELVALHARMASEMSEYRTKRESEYLWKPHADALTTLITAASEAMATAQNVFQRAEQRGLTEKAKALSTSMDKLAGQVQRVAKALQG